MNTQNFINQFSNLEIPILGVRVPSFTIEEKYKKELGVNSNITNQKFLRALCAKGFKNLNLIKDSEEYKKYGERVKYELDTIEDLGFTDYILLVWDIINYCKHNDIPTGIGRGSAASSLCLFLMGVTGIDPIKYELYFERFISKIRAKKTIVNGITYLDGSLMMDIDEDIDFYKRPLVLKYIEEKFKGKTSKILTFNTLSSKLLIKEVGKIVGPKSEEEMTSVTGLIPKIHGQVQEIEKTYNEVEQFKKWCNSNKDIYDISLKLKDLIKNKGNHPSGIMIYHDVLEGNCPTEFTTEGELISSYDMNQVLLFSVKVDILGLRAVSVIDDVCKNLNIKVKDINIHDTSIYDALQNLTTPHGLFQLEGDLGYKTTQKVKPKNFEQLSAILALARPGAMQFIDDYSEFSNNGIKKSLNPFFDDILGDTGNNCLYQEQLMKCLNKIGFTLDESEVARKIVGKKLVDKVKEWEKKIKDKVKENKLDEDIGSTIWRILNESASYSFNKCLGESTIVETETKDKMLFEVQIGEKIRSYDKKHKCDHYVEIIDKIYGKRELFEVELEDGRKIECSMEHKFLTEDGEMHTLENIIKNKLKIITD